LAIRLAKKRKYSLSQLVEDAVAHEVGGEIGYNNLPKEEVKEPLKARGV